MKRLLPYILMISLLCGCVSRKEFDMMVAEQNQINQGLLKIQEGLPLSVLDSCGIITGQAFGSCVAIGPNLILTAKHCLGLPIVEIGGVKYEIIEEWGSPDYDIGFVVIDGSVPSVTLGDMPKMLDEVFLVGAPYSTVLINSITTGIVCSLDRDFYDWVNAIQISSFSAGGNSGGPVFNSKGEVIGILVGGPSYYGDCQSICEPVSHIQESLELYNAQRAGASPLPDK